MKLIIFYANLTNVCRWSKYHIKYRYCVDALGILPSWTHALCSVSLHLKRSSPSLLTPVWLLESCDSSQWYEGGVKGTQPQTNSRGHTCVSIFPILFLFCFVSFALLSECEQPSLVVTGEEEGRPESHSPSHTRPRLEPPANLST